MLTKKQIQSLPAGTFPNSWLRRKFGSGHGSVVGARTAGTETKNPEDLEFIGNRTQLRWRKHNPLGRIKLTVKDKFQGNRFDNTDKNAMMARVRKLLNKLILYMMSLIGKG
jgi:hypothetical protein